MNLTISEIHFIIRNLEAREEWIIDNPNDGSEEEKEKENIQSALQKLRSLNIKFKLDSNIEIKMKDILDAVKLTLKLYPHKNGDELFAEIIEYLDRLQKVNEEK